MKTPPGLAIPSTQQCGRLFDDLPTSPEPGERFDTLLSRPGLRIERIVSTGQASPPGFWYEQPDAEWVVVLSGTAGLRLEDESQTRKLGPGDWLYLAPRRRHRVEWTDAEHSTVWLAVHFAG